MKGDVQPTAMKRKKISQRIELQNIVGVDLGGTNVRAALVNPHGRVSRIEKIEIGSDTRFERVAGLIADVIKKSALSASADAAVFSAVGIGSPGPLDRVTGVIPETKNLNWVNAPLTQTVSELLGGLPVYLENDAHAHAWGEFIAGAARGCDDMVMLTLGTGVGGAIICNSRLLLGKDGGAGHIGAMPIDLDSPRQQGFSGTVESLCSATAIAKTARILLDERPDAVSSLRSLPDDKLNARAVSDAAADGDPIAREVWDFTGRRLGVACAALANILNTERIIIGGGASAAWDHFYPALMEELERRTWRTMFKRVRVVQAALGDAAGIIGAAGLARMRLSDSR